ncbi:restriction endonuclease subunit S [Microbacterium aurantiacum]|uniref:restriction endonuclease subunit S n=1 Tax=Microbacterium aurantiacum TaxID=162393 RepID=UPI001F0194EC|nr:restriction endonuclease subunit S [Microbacterium aurantiacum]
MKMVELNSVATIERRAVDPRTLAPQTPYLGLEHIERGGRIAGRSTVGEAELASTKFLFTPEHVLFGKLRPNLGKISRPSFAGVCSTDILPILPGSQLDRNYLAHFLSQPAMVDYAASRTSGANLPRLSPDVLATFPIPLPSLEEQRRVAAILDRADAIRAKRRRVLAQLEDVTPALFAEIRSASQCTSIALADVAEIWDCPHSTPKWTKQGVVCLRTSNLTVGDWDWSDTRFVDEEQYVIRSKGGGARAGDIVLSREGTVGIAAIVRADMRVCMGQRLVQVRPRPDALLPEWALSCLLTALEPTRIAKSMVGSTAQHLNVKELRALRIPVPSLDVQRAFAERAARSSRSRDLSSQALAADDGLFASLQSRAFRGEL